MTQCPFPGPEPGFRTGIHWRKRWPGSRVLRSPGGRNVQHYGKWRPQRFPQCFPKGTSCHLLRWCTLGKGKYADILRTMDIVSELMLIYRDSEHHHGSLLEQRHVGTKVQLTVSLLVLRNHVVVIFLVLECIIGIDMVGNWLNPHICAWPVCRLRPLIVGTKWMKHNPPSTLYSNPNPQQPR